MKINLKTLPISDKIKLFNQLYEDISGKGIGGDTELAHVNKYEACVLRSLGGSGTINPSTNLTQYVGGGGSSGGGGAPAQNTTSTVQKNEIPEYFKPYALEMVETASQVYDQPYEAFTGQRLADVAPAQAAAYTGLEQFYSEVDPTTGERVYADPTKAGFEQATTLTGIGGQQFGDMPAGQFQEKYMSPYQQAVTDVALTEAQRRGSQQRVESQRQAGVAGAYGGSRQAILEAEQQRNLNRELTDIQTAGSQKAFESGSKEFGADRLAALKAGQQLGTLTPAAASANLTGLGALQTLGETQRAIAQQPLDINYEEFVRQRDYPAKQTQEYSGIVQGFPMQPSTYTTAQEFTQPPTLGSTLLSAGALYGGIQSGLSKGFFGENSAGGGLVSLADGGLVSLAKGGPPLTTDQKRTQATVNAARKLFNKGKARVTQPKPPISSDMANIIAKNKAAVTKFINSPLGKIFGKKAVLGMGITGVLAYWNSLSDEEKHRIQNTPADWGVGDIVTPENLTENILQDTDYDYIAEAPEFAGPEFEYTDTSSEYIPSDTSMEHVRLAAENYPETVTPPIARPQEAPPPTVGQALETTLSPMGFTEQIGAINRAAPQAWRREGGPVGFDAGGTTLLALKNYLDKIKDTEEKERSRRLSSLGKKPKKYKRPSQKRSKTIRDLVLERYEKIPEWTRRDLPKGYVERLKENLPVLHNRYSAANLPYTDLSGLASGGGLMSLSNGGPIRFQTGDGVPYTSEMLTKEYPDATEAEITGLLALLKGREKYADIPPGTQVIPPYTPQPPDKRDIILSTDILDRIAPSQQELITGAPYYKESDVAIEDITVPYGSRRRDIDPKFHTSFDEQQAALSALADFYEKKDLGIEFETELLLDESGEPRVNERGVPFFNKGSARIGPYKSTTIPADYETKSSRYFEGQLRDKTAHDKKIQEFREKLSGIKPKDKDTARTRKEKFQEDLRLVRELTGMYGDGTGKGPAKQEGFNWKAAMPFFRMAGVDARGKSTQQVFGEMADKFSDTQLEYEKAQNENDYETARAAYTRMQGMDLAMSVISKLRGDTTERYSATDDITNIRKSIMSLQAQKDSLQNMLDSDLMGGMGEQQKTKIKRQIQTIDQEISRLNHTNSVLLRQAGIPVPKLPLPLYDVE